MGNSLSSSITLHDTLTHLPLDSEFVHSKETRFNIQQNFLSFTQKDFVVTDDKGAPIIRFDGKIMSISGKVRIYDMRDGADKHIFTLRPKIFTMHSTMRIEKPDMEDTVNGRETSEASFREKFWTMFTQTFYLFRQEKKIYKIKGNFLETQFVFYNDLQKPVAQCGTGLWQFENYNNYQLRCAPGSDTLLCLIGMVAIDIVAHNKNKKSDN